MPKIFGNSLGNYNKSYCTFHQESNKIGFAFFWIFYDFLQNLQVSAINQTLFKMQVSTKPLKVLDSLRVGPWFADRPWKNRGLAIGSPGAGRRRSDQIPANRQSWPVGRGRRVICGVPRLDFDRWLGRWWRRWGRAAATAVVSYGTPCSGEVAARWETWASQRAIVGARGGGGGLGWVSGRSQPGARRDNL
jgi:hypothetical protein